MSIYELKVSYAERASSSGPDEHVLIRNSKEVVSLMAPLLEREVVEVCYVVCLTVPLSLIGYHEVSRGTLSETLVHPRLCRAEHKRGYVAAVVMWGSG